MAGREYPLERTRNIGNAKLPRFMVCTSKSFDGFMVSRIPPCVKKSALIFQSGFMT